MISRQRIRHRLRRIRRYNRLFPHLKGEVWCELGPRRCSCWYCRGVKYRNRRQHENRNWRNRTMQNVTYPKIDKIEKPLISELKEIESLILGMTINKLA